MIRPTPRWLLLGAATIAAALAACASDTDTTDAGVDVGIVEESADADSGAMDVGRDARIVFHDSGPAPSCNTTCDCPQGRACVEGTCRNAGIPTYCCSKPGCPGGQTCLEADDTPALCPAGPDAGTPQGDAGPGAVGAYCEVDGDCDPSLGLSCWTRDEPPGVWGYCTLVGCSPACPLGSECIEFQTVPPLLGCMQSCTRDADCRVGANCLLIDTNSGICIPDCLDDLLDCGGDGTQYCNRTSGQCEASSGLGSSPVGAACTDSQSCAPGLACMDGDVWGLPGGHCTTVCQGSGAVPCGADEVCQSMGTYGLCFKSCASGTCDRVDATCTTSFPAAAVTWSTPACLPQ